MRTLRERCGGDFIPELRAILELARVPERIERVAVLAFRESWGWEIRHPFSTDQFTGLRLAQDVVDYPRAGKRLYRNSGQRDMVDYPNIVKR